MKLWRFPVPWDYHQLGALLTVADTAEAAASQVNEFVRERRSKDSSWITGDNGDSLPVGSEPFTAEDADDVGPVFIQDGCDD